MKIYAGNCFAIVKTEKGLYSCGYNSEGELGLGHKMN